MSVLLPIAAAVLLALPVLGADNGVFAGVSAGQTSFSTGSLGDIDFEGDSSGYKVFGGYRFLTFVAVEASYVDFGSIEGDPKVAGYEADVNGLTLEAVAFLPFGIGDVFVKAGLVEWDADISSVEELTDSVSLDGNDAVYGAGIQFRIRSFAIRAEVEYFDVAKELYMVSVGGSYTF
jgi:hypothetical protein